MLHAGERLRGKLTKYCTRPACGTVAFSTNAGCPSLCYRMLRMRRRTTHDTAHRHWLHTRKTLRAARAIWLRH